MKTLRALAATLAVSLAILCALVPASAQTVNVAQKLTLAGLRSSGGRGSFPAAAYSADGSLFLLYDQGDGVRVLKLNAAGDTVLAQAQLGSAGDAAIALALDPTGNVYVTGTSTSSNLSGTSGSAFPTRADTSTNSFLAKFGSNLNTVFVTFLGAGRTAVAGVAATADAAFVTGLTFNAAFPVTAGGIQQSAAGGATQNGFVERFSASGTTLVYATYLTGANGTTAPTAIAADSSDRAYLVGSTSASGFPTLAALVPRIGGSSSGFLTKLTPAGNGFLFSTFIPGTGITGLALDESAQTLLLAGNVSLGQFPVAAAATPLTSASYQSLLRIATDGQSVGPSTVLVPGTQSLVAKGAGGSAWVAGTLSTPLFPGTSQPLALFGDSFALHVTSTGSIDQTSRFGGQPAGSFSAGSLTTLTGTPAVSADGATIAFPAVLTAVTDSSLASTTRFDLPLVHAPNAALTSTLRDLAASCNGTGQCSTGAGYLPVLSTADGVALSISADALPSVVLRNLGTTTATGFVLTATGFTVTSNCSATLAPSNACVAALTGTGPGTLTVSAANAASQTIALPANTLAPDPLAVLNVELDFGIQTLASAPATRVLTVTNLSTSTQVFTSAFDSLARSLPYTFAETASDCAVTGTSTGTGTGMKTLAAGATCHITIGFSIAASATTDTPVRAAWKVGTHDIALTGFAQIVALSASSTAIDFGTYFVNGIRLPRFLYLSNNSSASVAHTSVSLPASSPFTVVDECPGTLEAHSVCRLVLNYANASVPSTDSVTLALDQGLSALVTGSTLPQQGTTASSANPSVAVSPTAITFTSPVVVSSVSSTTQTVIVKNTGASSVPITVSITGDFTLQNGCPSTLAGGSSCQVLVGFAPAQSGQRQGLLAVTAGSGFAPAYVTLTGTATGILPANNGTLDIGKTLVGASVTVFYKLQQALTAITVASSSPAFSVALVEDDGTGPGSPPASAFSQSVTGRCVNCFLGVQFLSQTAGPESATLTFTTTPGGNPYTVAITATALQATGLLLTPLTQDFGSVPVNSSSAPELFSLTNQLAMPAAITITSVTASGDFIVTASTAGGTACQGSLAPTASCSVQVLFAPATTGQRTGTLTIVTSGGTVTAALSGFGAQDTGVAVNPVELDFKPVPGTAAVQQGVSVSNTGSIPVTIGTVTISDPSFAASSQCGTLAPGAVCQISVTFTPGFAQTAGTLTIPVASTTNGQTTVANRTVTLRGLYTTQDAGLQIVPGQANFGTVAVGVVGPARQFTLNNLTAKTVLVTLSIPRQFPLSSASNCGTLAAYSSCVFSVAFVPASAGAATGTLFAQGAPTDGSAALQTMAYMQGFGTGTAALTVSGNLIPHSPLMFGQVTSGQSTQQTLTLTNTGATPLTVRRVTSEAPFLAFTTCGAALSAAQSCTVTVTYAPTDEIAAGAASASRTDAGTLTIDSDAATSPDQIQLSGMVASVSVPSAGSPGPLHTFTLSQGALTFAGTAAGNASSPQTVTLTNTGTVTLHVLGVVTTPDFTVTSDCASLLPGTTCTLTVQFTPTIASTATTRLGVLELRTDASIALDFVTLIGTSSAPPLTLTPTALDFGTLNVGLRGTLGVTVTNASSSAVTFISLSATGDYSAASGTCPTPGMTLAAGATCVLQVVFAPTVVGTRTGMLSLTTDATALPLTVLLTGNAVATKLQISPGALAFGTIAVGAPANLSLTLLNTGTASVTGISATISGANAADFAVTVPCSSTSLAPNQGCTVTVTFKPSAIGARAATLTIASSDPSSPAVIALTGNGSSPGSFTLTVEGSTSASRTVASGSPATYTLAVTPVNGFSGAVALTCAPVKPGLYASCAIDPSTVTLNGGPQTSVVTINTITSAANAVHAATDIVLAWVWLPLFFVRRRRSGSQKRLALLILAPLVGSVLGLALAGCGSGDHTPSPLRYTPAGLYQYTVTATSTSGVQITQTVTLNLTVR